jgi:hypothetical protein
MKISDACLAEGVRVRPPHEHELCGRLQATRNPFFCFEQALIALSFSQKFLAFRSRLIVFCRLNFSGDRLTQFVDGPMRCWFPTHRGFLAVADQNPSFTGCPTFTRQLPQKENLSIVSVRQLPAFHCDERPMGFPDLAMHRCGGAPGLPICHRVHARRLERDRAYRSPSDFSPSSTRSTTEHECLTLNWKPQLRPRD